MLREAGQGDRSALDRVWPQLYESLHDIASHQMSNEKSGRLLQTTAVVHEAYFRLAATRDSEWQSRGDFLAAASVAMRRVLLDAARARLAKSRGGDKKREAIETTQLAFFDGRFDVIDLHESLQKLAELTPDGATALEMMIFGGATLPQIAQHQRTSVSTVERRIRAARSWLRRELNGGENEQ